MSKMSEVRLNGKDLKIEELVCVARDAKITVKCDEKALLKLEKAAGLVRDVVDKYKRDIKQEEDPVLDYGITTGFGEFKSIPIDYDDLKKLQENILLSHAAGVGESLNADDLANYFPSEVVRAVLVLRVNTFLKGHSGIRRCVVDAIVDVINQGIIPLVPLRGSVGSSGDLAPLAHLFLWLCERGRKSSRFLKLSATGKPGRSQPSTAIPALLGPRGKDLKRLELFPKEGLALTNGATFSAAMLALAVHDATALAVAADIAVAMSAEALLGCGRAFDLKVHKARNQVGQIESAENIRILLDQSKLLETSTEVQDPYSIRCAPAVHGASRDAIRSAREVAQEEINAATDNPLLFGHAKGWDSSFAENWSRRRGRDRLLLFESGNKSKYNGAQRRSYSAGNFHGQPVALSSDFLAIALAELANISERRIQLLMDHDHNRGLPANLIANAGVNSGFMIAQYCAAGLVSENKVLAHPASVDSIPTSANSEDHNSMATIAARKLRTVLANVRHTVAIELMVAAQALEWATLFDRLTAQQLPEDCADIGKKYWECRRAIEKEKQSEVPVSISDKRAIHGEKNGLESKLFANWVPKYKSTVAQLLGRGTRQAYLTVRDVLAPMMEDRVLAEDIRLVAQLIAPSADGLGTLVDAVESQVKPKKLNTARRPLDG